MFQGMPPTDLWLWSIFVNALVPTEEWFDECKGLGTQGEQRWEVARAADTNIGS